MSRSSTALYKLYFGGIGIIDEMWENTVTLTQRYCLPTANSKTLKQAIYPDLFSYEQQLLLPMYDSFGNITRVATYNGSRRPTTNPVGNSNTNIKSLFIGNKNNKVLYIVQNIPSVIRIKYCITEQEFISPDVFLVATFRHKLLNKNVINKYEHIIAIGPAGMPSMLATFGITPTILLRTNGRTIIDPLYITLNLLHDTIHEKNLSKSANYILSIEEFKQQHPIISADISFGSIKTSAGSILPCMQAVKRL